MEHKMRITCYGTGLYRYRCSCGLTEDDYIVREYAIDGWRESHGLEPIYGLLA